MSDPKISDVVKEFRTQARPFLALGKLLSMLERVGNLEKAEKDGQVRAEKAQAEAAALEKELDALRVKSKEARQAIEKVASEKAEVVSEAEARAKAALDSASREVARLNKQAQEEKESALASVRQARKESAALTEKIEAQKAALNDLEARIAETKRKAIAAIDGK